MRILTRYVLREFLMPLGYCLGGFVAIYVLFDLFGGFSRMAEAKLPFKVAVQYFAGYLAPYFHYLAPAALMLATIYTMWSFCRHSELTAMRSGGVSFLAIVTPLLSVALALAGVVVWVNESYVPRRAQWAAQLKTVQFRLDKIVRADNVVLRNEKANRTWNIDEFLDFNGDRLGRVRVAENRPDGSRLRNIAAERADYLDGEWWFVNPKIQHFDAGGREVATPVPELDALPLRCFAELNEKPRDFIMQNRPWKFSSTRDRLRFLRRHPALDDHARTECRYDIWAGVASPLACLIITLLSIPAGIASGRQSVFRGILGALGLYFGFYALTILAMVLAKNGWLPPLIAAFLPDLVFLALGIRAFRRLR